MVESLIQNSENAKLYKLFVLDKFQLIFDASIKHETYECKWYYGIIFYFGEAKWDVLHNIYMGNRLLISEHEHWLKDIPFHSGTTGLLPKQIKVLELNY